MFLNLVVTLSKNWHISVNCACDHYAYARCCQYFIGYYDVRAGCLHELYLLLLLIIQYLIPYTLEIVCRLVVFSFDNVKVSNEFLPFALHYEDSRCFPLKCSSLFCPGTFFHINLQFSSWEVSQEMNKLKVLLKFLVYSSKKVHNADSACTRLLFLFSYFSLTPSSASRSQVHVVKAWKDSQF